MVKIVISIPVHEAPDVVLDQIDNFRKFLADPVIIIHISGSTKTIFPIDDITSRKNVFINPTHLKTDWKNIISTHISNFKYACSITDLDYFVMHSSNDMYVRNGLEEYICQYQAGFNHRYILSDISLWEMGYPAWHDTTLQHIRNAIGQTTIVSSQIEGSFYRKNVMKLIVEVIEQYFPDDSALVYPREEFFFSTIAEGLIGKKYTGRPTTFSEVHRYDRAFFRYLAWENSVIKNRYERNTLLQTFLHLIDTGVSKTLKLIGKSKLSKQDIDSIRDGDTRYLERYLYLDDGFGPFELYDADNVFSVKRIPRKYTNPLRQYIRELKSG